MLMMIHILVCSEHDTIRFAVWLLCCADTQTYTKQSYGLADSAEIGAHLSVSRACCRGAVLLLRGIRCRPAPACRRCTRAGGHRPDAGSTSATTGPSEATRCTHTQLPTVSRATRMRAGSSRITCAAQTHPVLVLLSMLPALGAYAARRLHDKCGHYASV